MLRRWRDGIRYYILKMPETDTRKGVLPVNVVRSVEAMHTQHIPDLQTGVALSPWTLATIPEIPHWHHALEICYCLSGRGEFYFIDRQYEITPGDLIVVNNVERHTSKSFRREPCSNLFLFFHASTIEQVDFNLLRPFLCDRNRFAHKIPARLPVAREIGELIVRMRQELQDKRPAYAPLVKSMLFQICSLLLRHYHVEGDRVWTSMYPKYTALKAGLAYIQSHFREEIGLDHVAQAMALSPSRARHLFVEVMGVGFKTYLTHLRIQAAQQLLVQTDLSIDSLYEQCGFRSASSFYREFQKLVKQSPYSYKKTMCGLGR